LTEVVFCLERPRSRSYGRTAALRLIVQPFDEDEEKDDQFLQEGVSLTQLSSNAGISV
jgi:hypothetical protein